MAAPALLYERLAQSLAARIADGTLRAGERLPSVRRLSRQQRVSISTVLQAYVVLEGRGLVEARPQSGHFVRPPPRLEPPEPRPPRPSATAPAPRRPSTRALVAALHRTRGDAALVPLGVATLDPSLLPVAQLNRGLARVARTAGAAGLAYDGPRAALACAASWRGARSTGAAR